MRLWSPNVMSQPWALVKNGVTHLKVQIWNFHNLDKCVLSLLPILLVVLRVSFRLSVVSVSH